MNSRESSGRRLKSLVVVVPIVLLLVAVALNQSDNWTNVLGAGSGANAHPTYTSPLQMVGYSYETGPAVLDLTLANVGTQAITILNVTYDNQTLAVGQLGGSMPMFAMTSGQSPPPNTCNLATDLIIFPHFAQWNMDTGGLCTATISPGGPGSLFMGISMDNQTDHYVLIHAVGADYIFTVPFVPPYVSADNNATLTPGA